MSLKIFNVKDHGDVHTPLLIVHGQSTFSDSGIITVSHQGDAYPPLYYEVNKGFFKLILHLDPGVNPLVLTHSEGCVENGFPNYSGSKKKPYSQSLHVNYVPLLQNRPVHLCLLIAKDSPATFDSTPQKQSQEGNGLDLAIRKLRVGGRLMQAFTNEQMMRAGFGNRTFNFAEEYVKDTQFYQEIDRPRFRNTIKVHVLRSRKTLKELRDPDIAQQNPKGKRTGELFSIAMDELRNYGGPFADSNKPVQAAVMFLDAHWDKKLNLILTHAALGGGDDRFKLAIFGSHGIYSWPSTLEQVVPAFQDTTRSSTNDVANDCNECGTYWECMNVTLGAFMHEIGHSLGCPHQVSGVMLRDYVTLNRSFVTRELQCLRTGSNGMCPVLPKDECSWHRLDLLRFLHHPAFALPEDYLDPSFQKNNPQSGKASLLPMGNQTGLLKSATGIYAIEVYKGDLAHAWLEFTPLSTGGKGAPREYSININDLRSRLPKDKQSGDFDVHVLSVDGSQAEFHEITKMLSDEHNFIRSDFGLGRGMLTGIKSAPLGDSKRGAQQPLAIFDPSRVVNVRVFWGMAVDGIRFDMASQQQQAPPPVPQRDYNSLKSFVHGVKNMALNTPSTPMTISNSTVYGKQTNHYTDFPLQPGERITHFKLRCGAWIDAIQICTNTGRSSAMFGKAQGGGEGSLFAPETHEIIGLFGSVGDWVDSMGVIYVPKA